MLSGHKSLAASTAFALTLLSNVGEAQPSKCTLLRLEEWPVRIERGHLIVDGTINRQKVGVLLDTGAQRSVILRAAAKRLNLILRPTNAIRMFGVGGETGVEAAQIDEFSLGGATHKGWSLIVAGDRDIGRDVALILGEDFFQKVDIEFDLAQHAVRLFQPRDCDGAPLAYWASGGAPKVEFERVSEAGPEIILTVQINGQPVTALFDSGATESTLNLRDAARLGVTPQTPGVVAVSPTTGLGSKTIASWIGPFASFVIGDEKISDTRIGFADLWKDATYTESGSRVAKGIPGRAAMLLGVDFIRAHRLLIAHSQRKIYFTYAGGPVFAP